MIIKKVVDRYMDENTYILGDEKTGKCAVIDPGGSIIDILNTVKKNNLTVEYILLTHGHGDHISTVPQLKEKTQAKIIAHIDEQDMLKDKSKNLSNQLPGPTVEFDADECIKHGDIIELGSLKIKVIHTPGHTRGGVCFKVGENIFTGDTLFAGSIGRTDFYGGDQKKIMQSLKKLANYNDDVVVYPGHGPTSTIGIEKRTNYYMQQV